MCLCLHETLYHDICWQGNTAGHKESGEFVESIDDSFLTQVINDWTRVGPLLNMISTNKKELVGGGKVREILDCTAHEMLEFRIQREGNKAKSRITALDFSRADFVLFRDLLGRLP